MTTIYKQIKLNVKQLATSMVLIDNYVKEQNEMIEIYINRLNGSSSTDEVNFYQDLVKEMKDKVKSMISLKKEMEDVEFTTKHDLYVQEDGKILYTENELQDMQREAIANGEHLNK
jgi:hypothetical protein|tara:strand:+ start:458 stop:805 length:348 start_codon:yes stop_codon:yes gene_type:complete